MPRYRKKPVEIEAIQYDGSNFEQLKKWSGGAVDFEHYGKVCIKTLEGPFWARVGWYIIRGVKGEYYACEPDIFGLTYEPVE